MKRRAGGAALNLFIYKRLACQKARLNRGGSGRRVSDNVYGDRGADTGISVLQSPATIC